MLIRSVRWCRFWRRGTTAFTETGGDPAGTGRFVEVLAYGCAQEDSAGAAGAGCSGVSELSLFCPRPFFISRSSS